MRFATILGSVMACALAGFVSAAAASPPPVPGPPLPVPAAPCSTLTDPGCGQPQVPPAACSFAPLAATEIRTLYSDTAQAPDDSTGTVDPWNPCHVFRDLDGKGLTRSDDSGRSFATIYTPASSQLDVGFSDEQHLFYVSESGYPQVSQERYPLIESNDLGGRWRNASTGLPTLDRPAVMGFSPSAPTIGYAVDALSGMVFSTITGGVLWTPTPGQPTLLREGAAQVAVAVDPADPSHVFLSSSQLTCGGDVPPGYIACYSTTLSQTTPTTTFWESTDGGLIWNQRGTIDGYSLQLMATRPAHARSAVLYAETRTTAYFNTAAVTMVFWRSRDAGLTWTPLPVGSVGQVSLLSVAGPPPQSLAGLAFDPSDAAEGVHVVAQLPSAISIDTTTDGFQTVAATAVLHLPPNQRIVSARISADEYGNFFLAYAQTPLGSPAQSGSPPGVQTMVAFRPSAIQAMAAATQIAAAAQTAGAPAGTGILAGSSTGPPRSSATPLNNCALASPAQGSGSITFDGVYLDYTSANFANSQSVDETKTIYRIDPRTCAPAPSLTPQLPVAAGCASPSQTLRALTYDARYVIANRDVGAILALGLSDSRLTNPDYQVPIYAVDPVSGEFELAAAAGGVACDHGVDPTSFSYDIFQDALWTQVPLSSGHWWEPAGEKYDCEATGNDCLGAQGAGYGLARLPARKGDPVQPLPTCLSNGGFPPSTFTDYGNGHLWPPSTFVVGGPNTFYVGSEDDATVFRMDVGNCTVLDSFAHRVYSEAPAENDQMACDAVTFGEGTPGAQQGGPRSVLWIRDAGPNTVSSYGIPDGYCPFPSRVAVPDQTVAAGSPIVVCGTLRKANPSPRSELADEALTVSVGRTPVGQVVTDAGGRGCAATAAPRSPGRYPMGASFAGTHSYLPADGVGILTVVGSAVGAGTRPPVASVALPGGSPPHLPGQGPVEAPAPQAQAASQAQAEAQAQAQTQGSAQSVVQAQPGLMVQRQRQQQVAMQEQGTGVQTAYQATALLRRSAPAAGVAAALLMVGSGLLMRRPRWATARPERTVAPRRRHP